VLGGLVHASAAAGPRLDASRTLDEMHQRQVNEHVAPAGLINNAYVGMRDRDQTFFWLGRGISERSNIVQSLYRPSRF
jgi:hypothetical protein